MTLRLKTLAHMVPAQARVADIGTDHAYLPIELVKNGRINFAVASDIARGPLRNAQADITRAGLQKQIHLRLGPGLTTVKEKDRINTVVIAGMGGKLITEILNEGWLREQRFPVLVLQANVAQPLVRSWLMVHNYHIQQEKLLREAGHNYELLRAHLTDQVWPLSERELLFGPLLLRQKGPIFRQKWTQQLLYLKKLAGDLQKAKQKDRARIWRLKTTSKMIEEEIK